MVRTSFSTQGKCPTHKPGHSSGLIPRLSSTALTAVSVQSACISPAHDAITSAACSTLISGPSTSILASEARASEVRATEGRWWCWEQRGKPTLDAVQREPEVDAVVWYPVANADVLAEVVAGRARR